VDELRALLSRPHLHAGAVECGFYQRASGLSPDVFFDLLLYCALRIDSSLSFMASFWAANCGIQITAQSPDERFNGQCVSFIRALPFEVQQEKWQCLHSASFPKSFNRVRIQDSTRFNIPPARPAAIGEAAATKPPPRPP
jgi:hypothetical protein